MLQNISLHLALIDACLTPLSEAKDFRERVRYRIQKYYKEAGIRKKASVHTLRHTFATHQIHNGLKINQLKDVLGHKKMETTYKYVHLDRTNLRREMEAQPQIWIHHSCPAAPSSRRIASQKLRLIRPWAL